MGDNFHGTISSNESIMNKTETVQLFSKIIAQNEEVIALLKNLEGHQHQLQERHLVLLDRLSKLLNNQKVIWETLKQLD